jgi:hypothetical protein
VANRDPFDQKASAIVENHIRIHNLTVIPHPDDLKDAIANELRITWNDAIEAARDGIGSFVARVKRPGV